MNKMIKIVYLLTILFQLAATVEAFACANAPAGLAFASSVFFVILAAMNHAEAQNRRVERDLWMSFYKKRDEKMKSTLPPFLYQIITAGEEKKK